MELSFYGAGCVFISTKSLGMLVDPPNTDSGLKPPKVKADVTLYTSKQSGVEFHANGFSIDIPGEYEIKGTLIQGIAAQLHIDKKEDPKKGVIYTIQHGDLRALVTGNIAPELSDEQVEAIGEVNVMVIPVGGKGLTLDSNAAAKLISQFEPQYVIPVHYDDGATKYPMPQDKLDTFLQEVGAEASTPVAKLKVNPKTLGEEAEIVVLQRQG